jgi:hypothetical protein
MKRVRVIRETTGVVELQKLINPRVSNMASEDILINNQLQMGDVPLPRLITRGYCSMKRIVYIVIYNYMYVYIYIHIYIYTFRKVNTQVRNINTHTQIDA